MEELGLYLPEILLPRADVDLRKWAVIACDQYTSEPEYWQRVEEFVGDSPSTLHMILPECYLEEGESDRRINRIHSVMRQYLEEKILSPQPPGLILVDRKTPYASRNGLLVAVDLEQYSYEKTTDSLIRATEETILNRLPLRVKLREGALLDLPHLLLLINDPDERVIEPVAQARERLPKLYDFDLMMDSGHLAGYRVDDRELLAGIAGGLKKLIAAEEKNGDRLLLIVGDGNHSLAAAKAVWEKLKKNLPEEARHRHPARFSLVEIINLYDRGLHFEPIHRLLVNIEPGEFFSALQSYYQNRCFVDFFPDRAGMEKALRVKEEERGNHRIGFIQERRFGVITIRDAAPVAAIVTLQPFLDDFTARHPQVKMDYIHGEEAVTKLGSRPGNLGFYLPPFDKTSLFPSISTSGALPKKAFSIGRAEEKRFYMESRALVARGS
ncbi:MAG: DUF1015 domain-containing protein [Firmicutes bacterium]|jgi:hypothetical protein|nr:DUF1015 domain-containing protein [Bacillota bacterium]